MPHGNTLFEMQNGSSLLARLLFVVDGRTSGPKINQRYSAFVNGFLAKNSTILCTVLQQTLTINAQQTD